MKQSTYINIRLATQSDIDSMVNLSYQKRRSYEQAQPQFWHYAEGAEESQSEWFKQQLSKDDSILLVAESKDQIEGFIIGQIIKAPAVYNPGGLTLMIDDFCVASTSDWNSVGERLLEKLKILSKEKSAVHFVVVCGAHDEPKRQFLKSFGLAVASDWCVGGIQ